MTENDRFEFALFMNQLAEACANPVSPSPEKIDLYFECLKDKELAEVRANGIEYLRNNKSQRGFFPPVAYLRDPRDPDEIAQEEEAVANAAFARVKYYVENFYYPELGQACMAAIELKMRKANEEHLLPMLNEWGAEILQAPTQVVRAQFIKSFKSELRIGDPSRMLQGRGKSALLGNVAKQLVEAIKGGAR